MCPLSFLHGDDDQIVPIGASAMLSSKITKGANPENLSRCAAQNVFHLQGKVNNELLEFIGKSQQTSPVA